MKQSDATVRCETSVLTCPLCGKEAPEWSDHGLMSQDKRAFYLCDRCSLIYCSPVTYLPFDVEQSRYELHENNLEDPHYLSFLSRVLAPVQERLHGGMLALDYGSGPGPTMPVLLESYGISCALYDPIYAPNAPSGQFDLITSTETFEHFQHVSSSLEHIRSLLKPGGLLCIMTEQWTDIKRFSNWYYTRDDTHVCFYHSRTFDWIGNHYGLKLLHNDGKRVVCYQKIIKKPHDE
ncbi:MAG: class I SAM-dependent methyltransferase [Bacteroidetes bacterium]|nr:class I SAM-dependent methyltransferase [Bacteroidota bacterium]MCH8524536.1 class I SAM-dependent methyltransferase [Balneolales bacterium]